MDLGAYIQIDELEELAKKNGIEVSRLRGYRLMKNEKPVSLEDLYADVEVEECADLIEQSWVNSHCYALSWATDRNKRKYMKYHTVTHTYENGDTWTKDVPYSVKWEKIHGKHRKALKLAIKQRKKIIKAQYDMWNKYCGRDDVLYIHARLGTYSWSDIKHTSYKDRLWYLESCDDSCDRSYCDIYAKIVEADKNE